MNLEYIKALELRASWIEWTIQEYQALTEGIKPKDASFEIIPAYFQALSEGEIYFMNKKFCSLVDHARLSVPDDLRFDLTWMHSRKGWLYLEEGFLTPQFVLNDEFTKAVNKFAEDNKDIFDSTKSAATLKRKMDVVIKAIGWIPVGNIRELPDGRRFGTYGSPTDGGVAFLCYLQYPSMGPNDGYGFWSYFTVEQDEKVIDKIHKFEQTALKEGGAYAGDRSSEMLHEIRWVYTAMHLMAQRLAITIHQDPDRAIRRRAEREKKPAPKPMKVISLRRYEEDKKKAIADGLVHKETEWHFQWTVRGHWRNQYYPGTKEYKQIFVEAYIKGPEGLPLKNPTQRLFIAKR
jgi:hypothetical protein